jgi:hypothetical protein
VLVVMLVLLAMLLLLLCVVEGGGEGKEGEESGHEEGPRVPLFRFSRRFCGRFKRFPLVPCPL